MSKETQLIRSVKGTRDLLPSETHLWQRVEDEARGVFGAYNFREIRTPILEQTALFARSVGEDTDIVTKEMYTFADRDHESLTLRPEATASVVRAYIEHSLYNEGGIQKLYYIGPMFRRERPQKGRYRQFCQIGAEVLGSDHPTIDAEMLEMLVLFLSRLELKDTALLLNSVGCPKCRPEYLKTLRQALDGVKASLCADCQRRAETNPLRVLDCKVEADQPVIAKLPSILDHLGPECRQHFDRVTAELGARGIEYTITPRLVRGLDYYTKTTFEITSGALGAQNALLGGGRYDGLAEMIGGPPTPGIGFSIGEDRLVLAVGEAAQGKPDWAAPPVAAYVAWMGDRTLAPASALARDLRRQGLTAEISYEPAKLKKLMGIASKLGARFAIIVGEAELEKGRYQVKDMTTGQQEEVEPERIVAYLKNGMKPGKHVLRPALGLKERCQQALANALHQHLGHALFDSNGYVRELEHNLVRGVSAGDFERDFEQGAGDELRNKMKAPYSSSALVVNTFSRWRRHPSTLALRRETGFRSLEFEKRCPTGLQGTPPHLDLVAENAQCIVAVESKCTEYLEQKTKPADFSPSYEEISDNRRRSPWFTHMLELTNPNALPSRQYKWLDAAQLIKHYLGLSHENSYQGRRVILLYLYWEPKNWQEFPEFHEHHEEAARFGERVSGDVHVTFQHMSYLELWNDWRTLSTPNWLPDHVRALEERYLVSVPK
jgi:histidyl-tRNA synthetase